jgi:hypothetical protein
MDRMDDTKIALAPKMLRRAEPFIVRDEDGDLDPHAALNDWLDRTTSGLYPPEMIVSEVVYPGDVVVAVAVYGNREAWKFAAADGGSGAFYIGEGYESFVAARDAMKRLLDNVHKADGIWWANA